MNASDTKPTSQKDSERTDVNLETLTDYLSDSVLTSGIYSDVTFISTTQVDTLQMQIF